MKKIRCLFSIALVLSFLTALPTYSQNGAACSPLQPVLIKSASGMAAEVNSLGQIPSVLPGRLDYGNSTKVLLASSAEFIGSATNILDFSGITILVGANVAGIMCVEYSPDGLDWYAGEEYTILPGASKFYTPPVQSAFYRIHYKNNGLPQASFYIHSVLKAQGIKWSSHNVNSIITGQDDAILTKSTLTAEDETGAFVNIRAVQGDTGYNLKVSLDQIEHTTNSVKTITYSHAELHDGTHYQVRNTALLAKAGTKDILILPPNTTKWAHLTVGVECTDSATIVSFFENPTFTATGTIDGARNRNRNVADNNQTLIYENPTITATGTQLFSISLGSGKVSGGGARDAEENILRQGTPYLLRIVEPNVAATKINWNFDWYEHTNLN